MQKLVTQQFIFGVAVGTVVAALLFFIKTVPPHVQPKEKFESVTSTSHVLSDAVLANAEYILSDDSAKVWTLIPFNNGIHYEGRVCSKVLPHDCVTDLGVVANSATKIVTTAYGDLNGDGAEDAVVVMDQSGGGTGNWELVEPVLNYNGKPESGAPFFLDDREPVISLVIQDQKVFLTQKVHGPDDPACCPSQTATQTFSFMANSLQKIK